MDYKMSIEQTEDCVYAAKMGYQESLMKIIKEFEPFIKRTAGGYNIKGLDKTDLIQIGYIALLKAVDKYTLGTNKFTYYTEKTIRNTLKQAYREHLRFKDELSLNYSMDSENNDSNEFIECLEDLDNFVEPLLRIETSQEVRLAVEKLPRDEFELIEKVFYYEKSLKSYAEATGLNYSKVIRKRDKILKKLEKSLKKDQCPYIN